MVICKLSLSSPNSPFNQIVSLQASVIAMYPAYVVNKATVVYKVAFQLIAQQPIIKTYPVRDLLLSRSPTKSESTYPTTLSLVLPKCKQTSVEPHKYLNFH